MPFGANIVCDRTVADVDRLIAARPVDRCELLFIGRIWERKGGDVAMAVAEELNALGVPTRLTLVGSQPASGKLPDCVRSAGFLRMAGLKFRRRAGRLIFGCLSCPAFLAKMQFCAYWTNRR